MTQKRTRAIAFYLPQFHPVPQNDAWWGRGFTEWTKVVRTQPRFPGHYQPHLPADLGFYDLRVPEVREQQAALARAHGIEGFCYYHYWFRGRRVLDRVFREVLAIGRPEFPFCLCWANEPWTRNWDGGSTNQLMPQEYDEQDDLEHIRMLIRAFQDPRYITVSGRPLLLIYKVQALPDPVRTLEMWRSECAASGVAEPYICKFNTHGNFDDPAEFGCDAAAQFPPHGVLEKVPSSAAFGSHSGDTVFEYDDIASSFPTHSPPWTLYPTVFPGWDNSPRRPVGQSLIVVGGTPERYEQWLKEAAERSARECLEPIVFINAWNEWAEGAHLEPDERFGRAFLEATARVALAGGPSRTDSWGPNQKWPSAATGGTYADLYFDLYESFIKLQRYNSSLLASIERRESWRTSTSNQHHHIVASRADSQTTAVDIVEALAASSETLREKAFNPESPAVTLYLDLMKKCLTRYIFEDSSADKKLREEGRDWPSQAETMIGLKRLDNLQDCVVQVVREGIAGDLVETGVWRGGAAIFMRAVLAAYADRTRKVWAADSFQGLPKPDAKLYPEDQNDRHWELTELRVTLSEVATNFNRYGLLDNQVRLLPGWFRDSLPEAPIGQIAVLRLDGDMYESTIQALTFLYPKLSEGGYLIVDDYGYIPSCRQAVDDFRAEHGITDEIQTIDWTGVFWRRSRQGPFY